MALKSLEDNLELFRRAGGQNGWDRIGCYTAGKVLGYRGIQVMWAMHGQDGVAKDEELFWMAFRGDKAGALAWLDRELPQFMELVPAEHRDVFVEACIGAKMQPEKAFGPGCSLSLPVEKKVLPRRRRNQKRAERRKKGLDVDAKQG